MNALFELFGKKIETPDEIYYKTVTRDDGSVKTYARDWGDKEPMLKAYMLSLQAKHPEWRLAINRGRVEYIDKDKIVKEIDYNILWADVSYSSDSYHEEAAAILRPDRTAKDIEKFIDDLGNIDYSSGFGSQELFGYVVYKDGSWLERYEYDGSERWANKSCPCEPDWDEREKEISEIGSPDPDEFPDEFYERYYESE